MSQYTIRNVPESIDRELRRCAKRSGKSLNAAVIEAIKRGLGATDADQTYDDLDDLIGTWQHDRAFDQAIEDQDTVDVDAWR